MLIRAIAATAALVAGLLPLAAPATAEEAPVSAAWTRHDEVFTYAGITSYYSCDGLASKLKLLLRAAGARDDLQVSSSCVDEPYSRSAFTTARVTFYALTPAAPAAALAAVASKAPEAPARRLGKEAPSLRTGPPTDEPGVGAWRTVRLRAGEPRDLQAGDCELVEQFDRTLLRYFTTRGHAGRMTCVPHQVTPGAIDLSFEVLAPLPRTEQPGRRPVS